ncbi:MAG: hypothetical protein ACR2QS_02665 [Woeseiaceae bacterium]
MKQVRNLGFSVIAAATFASPAAYSEEDAETAEDKIARAMSAAPASISAEAMIVDVDGTVLREGDNGWTCFPGVGLIPGDKHPMCNDEVWMKWMATAGAGLPFETDKVGYSYMLMGDAMVNNDDPAATDPNDGGVWVQEGPHIMLLMPTSMSLDAVNHDPFAGGPYVMWGGTPLQHIMVPVADEIPE